MRRSAGLLVVAFSLVAAFLLVAVLALSAEALTPGSQLWVARYPAGHGVGTGTSLATSPDGSKVFVTGYSTGVDGYDYTTLAYDASSGVKLWLARYNGPLARDDVADSIVSSPDGSKVFVTGSAAVASTEYGYVFDYATVAYDASTGATLWVRRYDGPAHGQDAALAIIVGSQGTKIIVTGISDGGPTANDYATVAYDASTGATLWVRRYNGPGNGLDDAYAIAASPNGSRVFVTGGSEGRTFDYATVAYDVSTGDTLWVSRYNGPAHGGDYAIAIATTPDGSKVVVTGGSFSGLITYGDYVTLAYDTSTGATLWRKRYNGPKDADDGARAIAASPDGSKVFITGASRGTTSSIGFGYDYATVAYDAATGTKLWVKRFDGSAHGDDYAIAIATTPDGSKVVVTGGSFSGLITAGDYVTIAYDASSGAKLWRARYGRPGGTDDVASSIAASADSSKVFVTGDGVGSAERPIHDYATVAYAT